MRWAGIVGSVCFALLVASDIESDAAGGARGSKGVHVKDPGGDAPKEADIRAVVGKQGRGGKIQFRFRTKRRDRSGNYSPGLAVKAGGRTYNVSYWISTGHKKTGESKIKTHGAGWTLKFAPKAIGSPRSFRWRAYTAGPDGPAVDLAPNRGKPMKRLSLKTVGAKLPAGGEKAKFKAVLTG